jgi:hypothetical protein
MDRLKREDVHLHTDRAYDEPVLDWRTQVITTSLLLENVPVFAARHKQGVGRALIDWSSRPHKTGVKIGAPLTQGVAAISGGAAPGFGGGQAAPATSSQHSPEPFASTDPRIASASAITCSPVRPAAVSSAGR